MLGMSLITLVLLLAWILILVWLSDRLLRMVSRRTGWGPTDWRSWLLCFVLLVAGIFLGNHALDWLDYAMGTRAAQPMLAVPGAFLLGSVAIAVPVAGIRAARRGETKK
ncbi:hypothetical protein T8S45_00845 [Blastomonas marina]|uniref:hypothetical protein n=1 Tax=Blastomonas marina TaxID=1867408 RepID=UPI002AC93388|nr:hypothetical protein [Blastomonas marina]WPZ04111.1 hypothetical protein T8S45_00845 [Blastomonas marina]